VSVDFSVERNVAVIEFDLPNFRWTIFLCAVLKDGFRFLERSLDRGTNEMSHINSLPLNRPSLLFSCEAA